MTDARLRPGSRLRTRSEFDRVFAKPTRVGDRWFTVLARANNGQPGRLGLTVSKRVDKRAVQRNRLKRLIRESFRRHQRQLDGLDLVVIPRPSAAQQAGTELLDSLEQLWHRLTVHSAKE
jgi:ribonuclease P protein component